MPGDRSSSTAIAVRSLVTAGYEISGSREQANHLEIDCTRTLRIGAKARLLIAIAFSESFEPEALEAIRSEATRKGSEPVLVAPEPADDVLSWEEFLEVLGGAVPSWRALSPDYATLLESAAQNVLPSGHQGEAWQLFEDLAADGLEFLFGRRVVRLGGRRRGRKVSDLLAETPDKALLLVDAKAASEGFDANDPALRALGEYVRRQRTRQTGGPPLYAALVISHHFQQTSTKLAETSANFYSDHGVPVAFLESGLLTALIEEVRKDATIRNSIRWKSLFRGGLALKASGLREVTEASEERYPGGEG
jgi:hypothetical protein